MLGTGPLTRGGLRAMKALFYGDNLQILRDGIATESGDLIHLDPPFNSNGTYKVDLLRESGRLEFFCSKLNYEKFIY